MDDVLVAVFNTLAADFAPGNGHKKAITRFIWFRTTLPLVCKRWHRLVLEAPPLWSNVIIDPTAEAQHAKRLGRSNDVSGCPSGREPRGGSEGSSPARAASPALGSSPESDSGSYWTSVYAPYQTGECYSSVVVHLLFLLSSQPSSQPLGFCQQCSAAPVPATAVIKP